MSLALSVLCIADALSSLRFAERIIEGRPELELLTARRGQPGLELARHRHPALVLLDLDLPDIPGEVVLEQLKANPRTQSIPVVVMTADATPRRLERLLTTGAADYLTEPLDVAQLLDVLDRELNASKALAA